MCFANVALSGLSEASQLQAELRQAKLVKLASFAVNFDPNLCRLFLERVRMHFERSMDQAMNNTRLQMSEREAVERAQSGSVAGQARLYELYKSRVHSLCLRYTKDAFDSDDLTQDVFIQVFRKIGTFRGDSQFHTWLHTLALNFVRLRARRQRRERQYVLGAVQDDGFHLERSSFLDPAQRLALREGLLTLTSARRQAVLLHDIEGLTHNEIARKVGVSVIASKSRLHRAHVILRKILQKSSRAGRARFREGAPRA